MSLSHTDNHCPEAKSQRRTAGLQLRITGGDVRRVTWSPLVGMKGVGGSKVGLSLGLDTKYNGEISFTSVGAG